MGTEPRSWLSEGIIIAFVTASAYSCGLIHELAYCRFFGIPSGFISLSTTSILSRSILLIAIFSSIYSVISLLYSAGMITSRNLFYRIITAIILALLIFGIQYLYFGKLYRELAWVFSAYLLSAIILSLVSLPRYQSTFSRLPSVIAIVVFYSFLASYMNGRAEAEYTDEFLVINQSPKVVVLRIYGDYLFTAPFNPETREVKKEFFIRKVSEIDKVPLVLEKTGTLHVKNEKIK